MSSLISILVIAVIAIITNLNKNKGRTAPRGGMPSFGGDDGNPLRRSRVPARTGSSGFPEPGARRTDSERPDPAPEQRDYDASPAWPEPAASPSPDYGSGEGVSLEQAGYTDSVEARTERMQQELERLQAAFDGMAAAVPSAGSGAAGTGVNPPAAASARHPLTGDREALRRGLMWAEILGPPRSRKPHSARRGG